MDYILQQLSHLDLGQILVMGAMLWVMYTRILSKMDKVEERLGTKIKEVDDKLSTQIQKVDDKLSAQIQKLESRLSVEVDKVENKIQKVEDKLGAQIQKLDEKVMDIDRKVCHMDGALSKCCVLSSDAQLKKAE